MMRRRKRGYDVAFYVPRMGPLLTSEARSPTGGAETQIFLLARALARRGLRIRLLVFNMPGITLPEVVDGVFVAQRGPYRAHEPFGKLREIVSIGRAIADADADVLVSRAATPEVGLAGLFAKLSGRRFVYSSANISDFRDDDPSVAQSWINRTRRRSKEATGSSDFDFSAFPGKRRDSILFHLGVRIADELVVQTKEQVRLCESRFGRSPVLIRSIAEPAEQRTCEPEAFLWIARLVPYKRPLAYIELARELPEAKFWMVAPPEHPHDHGLLTAVQRGAASLENLEMLTPRPRRELTELVKRAVAMVNTADFEGMPNTFLEGWSRGVPALALTHDPDGAIEGHNLGGFAGGSSARFTALARQLWDERRDQLELAARCRRYVAENHSSEIVGARWQKMLRVASSMTLAEDVVT